MTVKCLLLIYTFLDSRQTVSTCNERGGLMFFALSVVGNRSTALFAVSVGGNMSITVELF